LLARAFAVQLRLMPPDNLAATKSLNSASDIWRRHLEGAIRLALFKAVSEAIKEPRTRTQQTAKLEACFEGGFAPLEGPLCAKTHRVMARGGSLPRNAAAVFDAFAEHCCTGGGDGDEDSFPLLYEPPQAWGESRRFCPMCTSEYDLFSCELSTRGFCCQLCSFPVPLHDQALDVCNVTVKMRKQAADKRVQGHDDDPRLQRLYLTLLVVKYLARGKVGLRSLNQTLIGKGKQPVGGIVGPGTENSAKGVNSRRGAKVAVELHDNLVDGRSGKDNNPDLRVYLLTGSSVQWTPSQQDLVALRAELAVATATWDPAGNGRLEVRGVTMARFDAHAVAAVMATVREAVHAAARRRCNSKLATCCPVLHYTVAGPVVTLLCSGNEMVKAVGWRTFSRAERAALTAVAEGQVVDVTELSESWRGVASTGLTWDMLVLSGVVTYCAVDRHIVLKESAAADFLSDGLSFYKISVELESSMRALQTEDAASGPMGHPIRAGYSIGLALAANRPAPLGSGQGTTSDRSIGLGPDPANIRSFIGDAPGNHYGSSIKLMALLHDFGARMQEDSLPLDVDAMRHDVFQHFTEVFVAASHHSLTVTSHAEELHSYLKERPISAHPKVADCIDDVTGLIKKNFTFVERGQAICFIPKGKVRNMGGREKGVPGKTTEQERKPLLHLATCDMWVKSIEAGSGVGLKLMV